MKIAILVIMGLGVALAQSPLLKEFNDGNNLFTADVYAQLAKSQPGNFLVCPVSVDIAMAFAQAGAKGNTALQISRGLHTSDNLERVQEIMRELSPSLQQTSQFYNLTSANKMYVKTGFQISENYKKIAEDVFKSEIENVNFEERKLASETMNKWVEEKTHDKIKNLIKEDDLDEDTRLVLINAMYFHGIWLNQFEKELTRDRPFFKNSREQVNVPMMETVDNLQYYESKELKSRILVLPYKGDFSMVIVLPESPDGLPELEGRMAHVLALSSQATKFNFERVHAIIPKFKIETTIQFKPILQALGITEAFEDKADFSGIGANKEPLKISKVVQKAFVEVEEEGTTAAAATAVIAVVPLSSFHIDEPVIKLFKADHPFLFLIKTKDRTLFIGRHVNE